MQLLIIGQAMIFVTSIPMEICLIEAEFIITPRERHPFESLLEADLFTIITEAPKVFSETNEPLLFVEEQSSIYDAILDIRFRSTKGDKQLSL